MKSDQEILDNYGRLLTEYCFDNQYKFILNDTKDLAETDGYKNLFKSMTDVQKKEIEQYTREILKGCMFDFLRLFEEHDEFKLYYENEGQRVNLVQISEMLKAEPIIENGWIERFSKTDDKKNKMRHKFLI